MGELWFVGAGLSDERGLSRRAIEVLSTCDHVFAEEYTSILSDGSIERLGTEIGRPIERLGREALEGQAPVLDALRRGTRVALIVAGDPFAATTHVALRVAAERSGHTWGYLPNASILTAASGFLGLRPYRFGPTVSVPLPEPGFAPTSPVERIAANRTAGFHTLVLLDLRPAERRFLSAHEAIAVLHERDTGAQLFDDRLELGVVARVGTETAAAWFGPWKRLTAVDFGPPLHALVVPAFELHFSESEAVERFRVR